ERLPPAAVRPAGRGRGAGQLHAAAGRAVLLDRVRAGHHGSARVHVAGDASGDPVLHARREAHRRRTAGSGEGMTHSARVDELVEAMTLEEKIAQLYGVWVGGS